MSNTLPKKLSFLICEDIRHESGGKVSLLGVFNDHILFEKPESSLPTYVIPQLCLYATFTAITTPCKIRVKLSSPSGKVLFETPANQHPGNSEIILLAVKIGNMQINELGTYTANYYFEDKKIKCTFTINTSN